MIGPSSTWICFIKWKLGVNGNENKIGITLSLIIAFGPEPWSNCTLSTPQKGVGWSYCMYTTCYMMLTQSPCLCRIFLRPRSVAIAVPKIGCQDEVNSCRPLRILKILLQKCDLALSSHLGTSLGVLFFLVCKKQIKIQANCQNWHGRRFQFASPSSTSMCSSCFAEGTKGSWSIGWPEIEVICAV
jgi:hypothetical protein